MTEQDHKGRAWRYRLSGVTLGMCLLSLMPVKAAEGVSDLLRWRLSSEITVPKTPAWQVRLEAIDYQGEMMHADGHSITTQADVFALGATWRPDWTLPERWSYAMAVRLPYVVMSREVQGAAAMDKAKGSAKDRADGVGDMVLTPAMFAYAVSDHWQTNLQLSVYAPTGHYDADRLANTGTNYWSVEPLLALSYHQPVTGQAFNIHASLGFNAPNSATDYDSGDVARLSATFVQHALLLGGLTGIGLTGEAFQQITDDSGRGATADTDKARSLAIGPVLSYQTQLDNRLLLVEFSWRHEFRSANTTEGENVAVRFQLEH
ncbi:transporter [Photobacterium japonica]|uniref:SphA family protein n=1 Tax=Photobacterium japonica TaxID=2910235 RepID=UPI003D0F0471